MKFTISKEVLFGLKTTKRLSNVEIARKLGCYSATVGARLKEFGMSSGKKIILNREELYDLYVTQRQSFDQIGAHYGCSGVVVSRRLAEFGISRSRYHVDISRKALLDLYVRKKFSFVTVGELLGCSASVVWCRLKEFGIPTRHNRGRIGLTSLEVKLQRIVTKHGLPYKFVGDRKFFIERYNPDFINTNSEKIAVEVYAQYYKLKRSESIEEWKRERSEVFKRYGWKVIYFDESEVTEEHVLRALSRGMR